MKFKHDVDKQKIIYMRPRARALMLEVDLYMQQRFKIELVVTSTIRTSGIHGLGCAFDGRSRDLSPAQISSMVKDFNIAFPYGRSWSGKLRPCAYYHDAGSGYHIHFQVNPRKGGMYEVITT